MGSVKTGEIFLFARQTGQVNGWLGMINKGSLLPGWKVQATRSCARFVGTYLGP